MALANSVAAPVRRKPLIPEELEAYLNREIKGQAVVTKTLAKAVACAENRGSGAHLKGSFLFLGPTGVGKTEMALALARYLYKANPEERVGRLTEFQGPASWGRCFDHVSSLGGGILFLDELDKAPRNLVALVRKAVATGRISLPNGETRELLPFYVIATLARTEIDGEPGSEGLPHFTEILRFEPLSYEIQVSVCRKFLDKEILRVQKAVGRPVRLQQEVFSYLIERGFSPDLGACPLRSCIEKEIQKCVFDWQIEQGHMNQQIVADVHPLELRVGDKSQLILAEVTQ